MSVVPGEFVVGSHESHGEVVACLGVVAFKVGCRTRVAVFLMTFDVGSYCLPCFLLETVVAHVGRLVRQLSAGSEDQNRLKLYTYTSYSKYTSESGMDWSYAQSASCVRRGGWLVRVFIFIGIHFCPTVARFKNIIHSVSEVVIHMVKKEISQCGHSVGFSRIEGVRTLSYPEVFLTISTNQTISY